MVLFLLLAAGAPKTPARNCYNAQGTNLNQRSSQSHTRARRSRIPAPPQGLANPASRGDASLGGCEVPTSLFSFQEQSEAERQLDMLQSLVRKPHRYCPLPPTGIAPCPLRYCSSVSLFRSSLRPIVTWTACRVNLCVCVRVRVNPPPLSLYLCVCIDPILFDLLNLQEQAEADRQLDMLQSLVRKPHWYSHSAPPRYCSSVLLARRELRPLDYNQRWW